MGKISRVSSIILIMLGGIALISWAGTGYAVGMYEDGIEENCDSTVGTIAQIQSGTMVDAKMHETPKRPSNLPGRSCWPPGACWRVWA